jgi:hypothetical protein
MLSFAPEGRERLAIRNERGAVSNVGAVGQERTARRGLDAVNLSPRVLAVIDGANAAIFCFG